MKLSELFNDKNKHKREVCSDCSYIQRPFQKELNDNVYCTKLEKFIEHINTNSCGNWVRWTDSSLEIL